MFWSLRFYSEMKTSGKRSQFNVPGWTCNHAAACDRIKFKKSKIENMGRIHQFLIPVKNLVRTNGLLCKIHAGFSGKDGQMRQVIDTAGTQIVMMVTSWLGQERNSSSSWTPLCWVSWWPCRPLLTIFKKAMVIGIGSWGLKENKYHSFLQEGQEEGFRELQDSQTHLNTLEGDGENHPGNHFKTYDGEKGDWE